MELKSNPRAPPVVQQPQWMPMPEVTNCPPGLEYLTQIDQLIIKQKVDLLEVLIGWDVANKFTVFNSLGQQVYFASEESDCLMRQCCGPDRGFIMHIQDNNGQEVLRTSREFAWCKGCCWCADACCGWEMSVEAPVGNVIGYIRQQNSKFKPHLGIFDADRTKVFDIWGVCCPCQTICCTDDIDFKVSTADGTTEVATIFKRWSGAVREMFTDADTFGVKFPLDLEVKMKALLLATIFMVDIMYFEHQENND